MRHGIFWVSALLALGGCVSVPVSPTPRIYSIRSINEASTGQKFSLPSGTIIDFGPVRIPEFLNRPQIVTENKDKTLKFSEFNRWGERLDTAFEYVISEDLAAMLPGAIVNIHPWNSSLTAKYQITVDVIRLESELDKDLTFVAQWVVVDVKTKKPLFIKRYEFLQPISPHDYHGLVETLNKACASLSIEIAESLVSLAAKDESKKSDPAPKGEE